MNPVAEPDRAAAAAVFVMPRRSDEWTDARALWITAAGWAAAARDRYGSTWVVTPDAIASPETVLEYTTRTSSASSTRGPWARVPTELRTATKDLIRWHAARRFHVPDPGPWRDSKVEFVWQHHDLFHNAGAALARRRGCPLVSYVHALQVWEATKWGVRRPGWGHWLERRGERPQLMQSDVVACVSEEVAAEVARLGVDSRRILVSPMAVNPQQFDPTVSGADVRARLGLDGCTVVGWTGSFRRFHGLEIAIEAFSIASKQRRQLRLMLVGDGPEQQPLASLAEARGVRDSVVFTGAIDFNEVPRYVSAMDIAVVAARADEDFHYSPLKMREYMAAAVPVVAPRLGEVPRTLTDNRNGLLYEPGDAAGLAAQLVRLHDDPQLRERLGQGGRELVLQTGTWRAQLDHLVASKPFLAAVTRRSQADGR